MSLVPIDKRIEEMIARKARETGKNKGEIYSMIVERVLGESQGGTLNLEGFTKSAQAIDRMKAHSPQGGVTQEIGEIVKTEMLMKLRDRQEGSNQGRGSDFSMKDLMLLKMMNQPTMTEIMLMGQMSQGNKGTNPELKQMMDKMAEDARENRQLMREVLIGKRTEEAMASMMAHSDENVDKVVESLAGNMAKMQANYEGIVGYITKGEAAGAGTLENLIANALKTRLVDEAMDAIDRGLFQRKEIVTPTGEFSWKGILDRMMNLGEELIKKMPAGRQGLPGVMPIRTREGYFKHPTTGQLLTQEQAQVMMQAAQMQPAAPSPGAPTAPSGTPAVETVAAPTKEQVEAEKKKKTSEVVDTFMSAGEPKGAKKREEQPNKPRGNEQY